jgi:hypothetical protein
MKITAELIAQHATAVAGVNIDGVRAAELAIEVERLNNAVMKAASRVDFNDEPARFVALLAAARQEPGRRK